VELSTRSEDKIICIKQLFSIFPDIIMNSSHDTIDYFGEDISTIHSLGVRLIVNSNFYCNIPPCQQLLRARFLWEKYTEKYAINCHERINIAILKHDLKKIFSLRIYITKYSPYVLYEI